MPTFVKVLQGRVIKFLPDKGYGFIELAGPGGEQVFFHMADSRRIYPGVSRPVFDLRERLLDIWPGTEVVFIRVAPTTSNDQKPVRPKAQPWGLYSEWEKAERVIEERKKLDANPDAQSVIDHWVRTLRPKGLSNARHN